MITKTSSFYRNGRIQYIYLRDNNKIVSLRIFDESGSEITDSMIEYDPFMDDDQFKKVFSKTLLGRFNETYFLTSTPFHPFHTRRTATYSHGLISFTLLSSTGTDIIIPGGVIVQSTGGHTFTTIHDVLLDSFNPQASVSITATAPGSQSNVAAGSIVRILGPFPSEATNVSNVAVSNPGATYGGSDEEYDFNLPTSRTELNQWSRVFESS